MIRTLFVSDVLPRRPAEGSVQRMDLVTGALAGLGPVDALFLASEAAEGAAGPVLPPEEAARFHRAGVVRVPAYAGLRALAGITARGPSAAYAGHQRRALAHALPRWATGTGHDLVWFNRERAWLPLRGRFHGRTVVDVDDFEDVLIRRWGEVGRGVWGVPLTPWQRVQARRSIAWWGRVHRRVAREADVTVVAAGRDAERLAAGRPGGERTVVVPNTCPAPPPAPAPEHVPGRRPTLLFQGSFDWPPNADAAAWLTREVLPRLHARVPGARVVLAGKPAPEVAALAGPCVEVTGMVPSMAPYLRAADLVVVPLRVGSGTRIKILEAFAHGVPVVSTTIGAEGLDVVAGEHLALADGAEGLALACAELLTDRARRAALAAAGGRLHAARHLPEHAAARVREAARRAVAG
ncbi:MULTISPECIES: glycosyltransferase family 4 protein [Streptomyces]|uniref:D-inositol 3-phosphate glycosyltransferase n=1 Tax=Streptomyces griseoaurantiacus TaxID=68213 RepID=A0A7W2DN06_9ACTN|nr:MULTISPECIES: glycosyltransferase family 4 protein [Streptomyces]MBA5219830.1 glycosyltransferase [Streptomyces griseoaurantiacus]MDX3090984.1 glycosyltransferase family 4 protein [Streptomyces sp. ME12-02E]MDX3334498.1 glycosyltransferase family 4 protein [Streptomyces sp. ME02-6978a]